MRLGFITGLQMEAKILQKAADNAGLGDRILTRSVGGRADVIRQSVSELKEEGVDAVISCGYCGGLDPALPLGALLLPSVGLGEGNAKKSSHTALRQQLLGAVADMEAIDMPIVTVIAEVCSPEDKIALGQKTGAAAVDMETFHTLHAAAEVGLPAAVIRVISDPVDMILPPSLQGTMTPDGRISLGRLSANVLRRPADIPRLMAMARHVKVADESLRRAASFLFSGLGAMKL